MRIFIYFFLLFQVSSISLANTLVISDIDDTIKIANIRDKIKSVGHAFDYRTRFFGMNELYRILSRSESELVYLSRAPEWLMKSTHLALLERGEFPSGEYRGRRSQDSNAGHKQQRIREFILKYNPTDLVLIGDNGEQDPQVFQTIATEFSGSQVRVHRFIRILYRNLPIEADPVISQPPAVDFVSPFEIAIVLAERGLLAEQESAEFIDSYSADFLAGSRRKDEVYFTYFQNCRDYSFDWAVYENELFDQISRKIQKNCKSANEVSKKDHAN